MADKYLIALDQSTQTTGYAIYKNAELVQHGAVTFSGDIEKRLLKLRDWVLGKLNEFPGASLAFEDIQLQDLGKGSVGVTTYKKLAWVQGMLLTLCAEHKLQYEILAPSSWRSLTGVKGQKRADQKLAAQARIKEKYNFSATEDEADAICLGDAALAHVWAN